LSAGTADGEKGDAVLKRWWGIGGATVLFALCALCAVALPTATTTELCTCALEALQVEGTYASANPFGDHAAEMPAGLVASPDVTAPMGWLDREGSLYSDSEGAWCHTLESEVFVLIY